MKKLFISASFICLIALSSCGSNNNPVDDSVIEHDSYEQSQENSIPVELYDNLNQEEEEQMSGHLFYDLGPIKGASIGDSCFMEPILQNPTQTGVTVQWFTENEGDENLLYLYDASESYDFLTAQSFTPGEPSRVIPASTIKLSRIRGGKQDADKDDPSITCDIYKHVAIVDDLPEYHGLIEERFPYQVVTDDLKSPIYTLSANPAPGTPLRLLLTSDHQIKDMVAANIQKVYETVGKVDGVLVNGDLVDVADRCYDWFYADNAFFRCLTGTAIDDVNGANYFGAPFLQEAPIYTSIGNHDVMGQFDNITPIVTQFNEPRTRQQAENKWNSLSDETKATLDKNQFILDHSYNTITTEEIFESPTSSLGGKKYYATSFGDIRLISLDVSRVWRLPNIGLGGKYSEIPGSSPEDFAEGEFIFESIKEGSDQINFLDSELSSDEYNNSLIKMVMFHSEAHSMGGNQIPAYTDPVPKETISPITGQKMTIYDYPIDEDYIINVIEPRLEKNNANLLFEAHSHLWNRFKTASGMNILETSNVGNSYGGFDSSDKLREQFPSAFSDNDQYHSIAAEWDKNNYILEKDPYGLEAIMPNIAELPDKKAYLDSNTITSFSILDTYKGTVDSYYFDTEKPDSDPVLFDSFSILDE